MSRPDHVQRAMKALFGDYHPDKANAPTKEPKPEPMPKQSKQPEPKKKPAKKSKPKQPEQPKKTAAKRVIIHVDEAQPILKQAYAREKSEKMTKKMSEDLLKAFERTAPKKEKVAILTPGSIQTANSATVLKALPFLAELQIRTPTQLTSYLKRNSFLDFGYGVLKSAVNVAAQDFFRVNNVFNSTNTAIDIPLLKSPNYALVNSARPHEILADAIDLDDREATSNVSKDEKVHHAVNEFKNLGYFDNAVGVSKDGKRIKKKSYQGAASDLGIIERDKKSAGAKAARMLEEKGSLVVGDTMWFSKKFLTAQANKAKDMVRAYVQSPPKDKPASDMRAAASAGFDATENPIIVGTQQLTAEEAEQLKTGEKTKFNMLAHLNNSSSDEEGPAEEETIVFKKKGGGRP
jgi:hypothetical protein